MPSDFDDWHRTGTSLTHVPAAFYTQAVSSLSDLGLRLRALPVKLWLLILGGVIGLIAGVIWLRRWLTRRVIEANPEGRTAST